MNKLWYGGSFNPVHMAHLICARAVAEAIGAETLVLVPSNTPPHKQGDGTVAEPHHRLALCKLATAGVPGYEVDDREIRRRGPSYTIDTVRQLRAEGVAKVRWLIGADMLMTLGSWREPDALLAEAEVFIMARPGYEIGWDRLPERFGSLRANVVQAPLIQLSATSVRERVRQGQSIEYLTPPAAIRYIESNGLYR